MCSSQSLNICQKQWFYHLDTYIIKADKKNNSFMYYMYHKTKIFKQF